LAKFKLGKKYDDSESVISCELYEEFGTRERTIKVSDDKYSEPFAFICRIKKIRGGFTVLDFDNGTMTADLSSILVRINNRTMPLSEAIGAKRADKGRLTWVAPWATQGFQSESDAANYATVAQTQGDN
jgi:hypothetical protein